MGEEATSQGTSRFVDSSLERLQVKVSNWQSDRYVLTCNGRRVPLLETDSSHEFVAGVRYRAWQPPSALHPLLGVDSPLVFDVIDKWNMRSIGGCTYHVSHPGGRSYDVTPVNALEAQGRRINRFFDHGHTIGTLAQSGPVIVGGSGRRLLEGYESSEEEKCLSRRRLSLSSATHWIFANPCRTRAKSGRFLTKSFKQD